MYRRRQRTTSDPAIPVKSDVVDQSAFNSYEFEVDVNTAWEIARDEMNYDEASFRRSWKPEMAVLIAWLAEYPKVKGTQRISGSPSYLSQTYAPYRLMCDWGWKDRSIGFVFDIAEFVE
jgi:hypothetical protein